MPDSLYTCFTLLLKYVNILILISLNFMIENVGVISIGPKVVRLGDFPS